MSRERDLLIECKQALNDWIHTYAPEMCHNHRVQESKKRISEYGTIGYIADKMAKIDAILSQPEGAEMSRERELLKDAMSSLFKMNWLDQPFAREAYNNIKNFLSQPEAEPSKTIYGVLATAYRPDQHEASMEAVERHKGATPETDAHLSHLNLPDGRKIGIPTQTVDLLRCLERQRDELRAENAELRSKLNKGA